MSVASIILVNLGRLLSFVQVLFYLPLALDIAGKECFLALSAALASYYFVLSTVRLICRNTRFAWVGQSFAVLQFLMIPACLLICFNVYSPPSSSYFAKRLGTNASTQALSAGNMFGGAKGSLEGFGGTGPSNAALAWGVHVFLYLARHVPRWWETLLRLSSPFFSLLEGIASLLVIQSLAHISRWVIERGARRGGRFGGAEGFQLLFLLASALTYVGSAVALWASFEGAARGSALAAALVGVSVSSTLWLTGIAFAVRKGNVIETSLMLAYVVFNIYQLSDGLGSPDPLALIRSFKPPQPPLPPLILESASALLDLLRHTLGHSIDFIAAAAAALPSSVIVSLVYRVTVLYAASRILPHLKRASDAGVPPFGMHDDDEPEHYGGERRLSDEEPFGAFISIIVSYSRLILIAVYSHLLLLDQSHQIYWRFLTVGLTLTVWAFELLIGKEEADSFTKDWKVD